MKTACKNCPFRVGSPMGYDADALQALDDGYEPSCHAEGVSMLKVTAQQRANAIEARDVMWPSVPPQNVARKLGAWRSESTMQPPTCGTIACFGGWCAYWPTFVSMGVRSSWGGSPLLGGKAYGWEVAEVLFGASLFESRGHFDADKGFDGTDHELVTHRLNWLIKNSKVAA